MRIFFARHGIAAEPDGSGLEVDSQRPLTAKGRDKINKIAHVLKRLDVKPNLILSSPLVRAEQTAALLAKELGRKDRLKFSDLLVPTGNPEAIISEIVENYMVDELLIVGHEPCLGLLISTLVAGNLDLGVNLKKGGVCCASADDLRTERRATMEWLLTPEIALKV